MLLQQHRDVGTGVFDFGHHVSFSAFNRKCLFRETNPLANLDRPLNERERGLPVFFVQLILRAIFR